METKLLYSFLLATLLSSCAVINHNTDLALTRNIEPANILNLQSNDLANLPPAKNKPVIAVYRDSFQDLTGQRKSSDTIASFSTAVTQGASHILVEALRDAGKGNWFVVVERGGLDNLTKERQLI